MSEQSIAQANQDVQSINGLHNSGEKTQMLANDVNEARSKFTNPADYNEYLQNMQNGFKNDENLLHSVELIDFATAGDGTKLAEAINRNNDQDYKLLDTYAEKQGHGQLDGRGSGADGKVGEDDIQRFLADSKIEGTEAYKAVQANPELGKLLNEPIFERGFDKEHLLESEGKNQDYLNNLSTAPVVFRDAKGRPETIVEPNGTTNGLSYDANGNINGMNYSGFNDGVQVNGQAKLNEQGQWVDENGNPSKRVAPFVDGQGNFGFYQPVEGQPSQYTKFTVDSTTGKVSSLPVDLNGTNPDGTPVAINGLNRGPAVDVNNHDPFKYGRLDVSAIPNSAQPGGPDDRDPHGQAGYTIKEGDNLTNIARAALGVDQSYDGPEVQAALNQLARANGYENPDQIPAGATLVVPKDFNTRPPVAA